MADVTAGVNYAWAGASNEKQSESSSRFGKRNTGRCKKGSLGSVGLGGAG